MRDDRAIAPTATRSYVLIVEDEPDMVKTYERLLRRYGYRVESVGSRQAGLTALEADPPALLISDVRLPDGDGLDVVRRARALPAPPSIIVVTGFSVGPTRDAALAAGATAFVSKPFSTEHFMQLIQSLLDRG